MLTRCKAEITVRKVDNGYILEWETEKVKKSNTNMIAVFPPEEPDWMNPTGVEIIKTLKELMKRIQELM